MDLARGFEPTPLVELVRGWGAGSGLLAEGHPGDGPHEWRVEVRIPTSAWREVPGAFQLWRALLPDGPASFADPRRARLRVGAEEVARSPRTNVRPGGFGVRDGAVEVRSAEPPAEEAVLELSLLSGEAREGRWYVNVGDFSGVGIPVWSGERESVVVDVPPDARLWFTPRHATAAEGAPVTLRVRLDGEVLCETVLESEVGRRWVSADLPAGGVAGARLDFEVEGPRGLGCFAAPTIRTSAPVPGAERPDVVLFLADTFRADLLEVHAGEPGRLEHLDRLARESLCFLQARSSASWTLPSINALLTGHYPVELGIDGTSSRVPADFVLLAERFARAGYRTGAVTDGVFFSTEYGLERGFEWFRQRPLEDWSLAESLADVEAFLDGDDGRPTFLVFHTYRAHGPYRTGSEESEDEFRALQADVRALRRAPGSTLSRDEAELLLAPEALALYVRGAEHLDQGFGELRAMLEQRGMLAGGYLAFTADHGEAFGENDCMKHGGPLWDSRLRVPLMIRGPGLAPRLVPWTVSNVDLAPTLAALAGLEEDPSWLGASLLEAEADRQVFAFLKEAGEGRVQFAVCSGRHKLLASSLEELEAGTPARAHDVVADPLEEHDLAQHEPWVEPLARSAALRLRALLERSRASSSVELSAALVEDLEALGYGGE